MKRYNFSDGEEMKITVKHFNELTNGELYEILRARAEVFVVEQNCPYQDLDGKDFSAYHVFLSEEGKIKAYVRVLDRGVSFDEVSIGRVITTERKKGYGAAIMKEGIRVAKEKFGADKIRIGAQVQAEGFYEKLGFKSVSGSEFLEDDIPHIEMILNLTE